MRRAKKRTAPPDDDEHQPGAYQVQGRAPGQLPVWARIRSLRRVRSFSAVRHRSLASPSPSHSLQEGPELAELSTQSVVMGGDDDSLSMLSLVPIADTPLEAPYEPWRDNVDIPSHFGSQRSMDSERAIQGSSASDDTTDYSLPQELSPAQNRESSSRVSSDPLPHGPSFSSIPPEIRPVQAAPSIAMEDGIGSRDEFTDSGSEFIIYGQSQKYRRRRTCLLFLFSFLTGVGIGVGVGMSQRNKREATSDSQEQSGIPSQCNYSGNNTAMPNAFVQCECDGSLEIWTDEIETQYSSLRDTFIPTILPDFDEEKESCDPTNSALWQLSNDSFLGANVTDTRYLLTLLYAKWGGEGWRRRKDWMSTTIPECQWEGIRCSGGGQVRSLSLESNNLGGTIPTELPLMTSLRMYMIKGW